MNAAFEAHAELAAEISLETQIDQATLRLKTAPTPDERRTAWDELKRLHGLRSEHRVATMEHAQGLDQ